LVIGEVVEGERRIKDYPRSIANLLWRLKEMIGLPMELASVVGIAIVGHIGGTVIAEMGGKMISIGWNLICYSAATFIGLKYTWDAMHKILAVVGGMW
jgi:hypothetical protein